MAAASDQLAPFCACSANLLLHLRPRRGRSAGCGCRRGRVHRQRPCARIRRDGRLEPGAEVQGDGRGTGLPGRAAAPGARRHEHLPDHRDREVPRGHLAQVRRPDAAAEGQGRDVPAAQVGHQRHDREPALQEDRRRGAHGRHGQVLPARRGPAARGRSVRRHGQSGVLAVPWLAAISWPGSIGRRGAALGTREKRPICSDPTERPWPRSHAAPISPISPRPTLSPAASDDPPGTSTASTTRRRATSP